MKNNFKGDIRIENKTFEILCKLDLSRSEYKILLFFIRKIHGYHKKRDMISNSQIMEGTGLPLRTVIWATNRLQLVQLVALVKRGSSKNACNIWKFDINNITDKLMQHIALVQKDVKNYCNQLPPQKILLQKKYINNLSKFRSNKKDILKRSKEMYPNKNCEKAIEDFIEYCEIHKVSYKRYDLAFLRWIREDRFNQYSNKLSKVRILK